MLDKFVIMTPKISFEYKNKKLHSNRDYLMPINEIQSIQNNIKEIKPFLNKTIVNNKSKNDKCLIIRMGGIGDIISSLFGIVELSKISKNIYYTCFDKYKEIFNLINKDLIKGFDEFPICINDYHKIICLESLVENDFINDIQTIFANAMDVSIKETTYEEVCSHFNQSAMSQRESVGIQLFSNALIRNYSIDNYIKIINMLLNYNNKLIIFLLDKPDNDIVNNYIQVKSIDSTRLVLNGSGYKKLSIKESIELVSQLKVLLAPDSSMIHAAAIYKTPTIGLYGPFDHKLRTIHYNNSKHMIQAEVECGPCNRHNPVNFCPITMGEGYCLNQIEPEYVASKIIEVLSIYDY